MKNNRTFVLFRLTLLGKFDIIIKRSSKERGDKMIEALDIANNILQRAFEDDIDVTPMKLQKLIYCVYKDYLKTNNLSLFDENFEAWRYGPVLPSVYNEFRDRGANRINRYAQIDRNGRYRMVSEKIGSPIRRSLDKIWRKYRYYDGIVLSKYTHGEDTAWRKAIEERRRFLFDSEIKSEEDYE